MIIHSWGSHSLLKLKAAAFERPKIDDSQLGAITVYLSLWLPHLRGHILMIHSWGNHSLLKPKADTFERPQIDDSQLGAITVY